MKLKFGMEKHITATKINLDWWVKGMDAEAPKIQELIKFVFLAVLHHARWILPSPALPVPFLLFPSQKN